MQWKQKLQSDISVAGVEAGGNKLRTYRTFKENYGEEQYVRIITQKSTDQRTRSLDVELLR